VSGSLLDPNARAGDQGAFARSASWGSIVTHAASAAWNDSSTRSARPARHPERAVVRRSHHPRKPVKRRRAVERLCVTRKRGVAGARGSGASRGVTGFRFVLQSSIDDVAAPKTSHLGETDGGLSPARETTRSETTPDDGARWQNRAIVVAPYRTVPRSKEGASDRKKRMLFTGRRGRRSRPRRSLRLRERLGDDVAVTGASEVGRAIRTMRGRTLPAGGARESPKRRWRRETPQASIARARAQPQRSEGDRQPDETRVLEVVVEMAFVDRTHLWFPPRFGDESMRRPSPERISTRIVVRRRQGPSERVREAGRWGRIPGKASTSRNA